MSSVRVVIADDHALLCEAVSALIDAHGHFQVIGTAHDGRDCERLALREQPDLVILDCVMPGLNGIETVRRLAARESRMRLICMSAHEEARWIRAAFDAGAHGYVLKRCVFADLLQAMTTVMRMRYYVNPDIAHTLIESNRHPRTITSMPGKELSSREREIAQLIAEGYATHDIAERLHISTKTVATHRDHIMRKLGLRGVAQLTRYALREGLTTLDMA